MKELKVGEELRIRCVEDTIKNEGCGRCFFAAFGDGCNMNCKYCGRTDGKNVHFELVEE